MAQQDSSSYSFWFRNKFNLPPKDPRYLSMEKWEIELEFLTWDAHERTIAKSQGKDQRVEEFEVDDDEFKRQRKEFDKDNGILTDEWEEV